MNENDIFRIRHNKSAPAKGRILIAEPFLRGVHFERSVVLLVEHDKVSTFGLTVNKPTRLVLNDYFPAIKEVQKIPIYLGGPVNHTRVFFIHTLGDLIPGSQLITDSLYFDGDLNTLLSYIVQNENLIDETKFFLGYSGWTKGQLAREIERDSWFVSGAHHNHILQAKDESFWRDSLSILGKKYRIWVNFPKNPMLN